MSIEEIIYSEIDNENFKIVYKERNVGLVEQYKIRVFCCSFENNDLLRNHYRDVVNSIAINVQAKIDIKIERYNIYILFFTKDEDYDLAFEIEKDMYSSRKIVIFDELSDDLEKIEQIINEKLFYIHNEIKQNQTEFELDIFKLDRNYEIKEYIDNISLDEIKSNKFDIENIVNILKEQE